MMTAADRSLPRPARPHDAAVGGYDLGQATPRPAVRLDRGRTSPAETTSAGAALRAFVDHFEEGLAVVDARGRVLFANTVARAIIRGPLLLATDGVLRGGTAGDSMALRALIAGCADGGGGSLRLARDDDSLLIAANAAGPAEDPQDQAAVLLRLTDPARVRLPDRQALQAQFGLTPTEAAFALEMLAGHDLAASAVRRGITLNTGRVHLRRIFEKTETRRQAALIRLLLLCPRPVTGCGAPDDDARSGHGQGHEDERKPRRNWARSSA
jgi:DNA-binding CsgD family transcriptional regulator